ncbi:uncharacterized protein N7496_004754 [Penicillium cataractarum]|uniref:DUF2406 domain-containing protein n=1 Tax=Penicillium cataractarum TaxID=2100454 RepID=A0A9W9SFA4_9EURO|nr:uncharacterized protein N7496_004754 [Penicillium cataractarum]KAJ5377345.1 hypothetical protein N7496_004754 [Penicillium cataractarum]
MAGPQQSATSPRRSRGFSVKSESSHKSHLSESSQEKARRSLHTKADPTVAMNELQPMAVALEKSNMGSLRAIEHKDQYGNPITDPDWSNPTRPRFERPLDTIRSFEAAIYGTYTSQRPVSYARTGSFASSVPPRRDPNSDQSLVDDAASQMGDYSRRTSYYGGQNNGYSNRAYGDQNGYGRNAQSRPDSMIDAYGGSSQAPDNYYPYNQNGNGRRPRQNPRQSEQGGYANGNGGQYAYQQQNHQRSYDNVTAMSGSGYTDSYGQSTDPSSLNSSMDQLQQQALQQQRLDERAQAEYGFQGFGGSPNMNVNGKNLPSAPAAAADPNWGGAAPANGHLRKTPTANVKAQAQANPEKRKSWFKKRFSKG